MKYKISKIKKIYSGKKIEEKKIETKLSNNIKNQLKNTDQIKTSPIKKIKKKK